MPRFFFRIHDTTKLFDDEGIDLPDWQAAKEEALRLVSRILRDGAKQIELGDHWTLHVVDEDDLVLIRLDFGIWGSPAITGAEET